MEMLSEVDIDLGTLADVISRDPVLAATVMKYANSPLYRRITKIKSVRNAVNLLGLKNVATAILIATMRSFNQPPNTASETLWEHSTGVAALARIIARDNYRALADKVEFLATIHDIGALVLASNLGKQYVDILKTATEEQRNLEEVEQEILGYTNDDVTPYVLEKLKLPEEFSGIICHLHNRTSITELTNEADTCTAILSLAHLLEKQIYGELRFNENIHEGMETLCTLLKISDDKLDDITEEYEELLGKQFS